MILRSVTRVHLLFTFIVFVVMRATSVFIPSHHKPDRLINMKIIQSNSHKGDNSLQIDDPRRHFGTNSSDLKMQTVNLRSQFIPVATDKADVSGQPDKARLNDPVQRLEIELSSLDKYQERSAEMRSYNHRNFNLASRDNSLQSHDHSTLRMRGYIPRTSYNKILQTDVCDPEHLSVNDSDVDIINTCRFPVVSLNDTIDKQITNLSKMNLPLLPNYRSPCWYEDLPVSNVDSYITERHSAHGIEPTFRYLRELMDDRRKEGGRWRMRCLPLVNIIGVTKCGTTDLFDKLIQHPHIVGAATKEVMYWNIDMWGAKGAKFADYLDIFDEAAEQIRTSTMLRWNNGKKEVYHPLVTVDASINSLYKYLGTKRWWINKNSTTESGPSRIAAHMLKNIIPEAKIIVILRDPVERLWSEYLFFNIDTKVSAAEFDGLVKEAITRMLRCQKFNRSIRSCVYDKKIWAWNRWVRIISGMYAPFIEDWLGVFPNMKVIRTEDWHADRAKVYRDLLGFLQLEPIVTEQVWSDSHKMTGPSSTSPLHMYNSTKKLLTHFYQPYNHRLAKVLNDDRFLWHRGHDEI